MKKALVAATAFVVFVCSILGMFEDNRYVAFVRENLKYGDPLHNLLCLGGIVLSCCFLSLLIKSGLRRN